MSRTYRKVVAAEPFVGKFKTRRLLIKQFDDSIKHFGMRRYNPYRIGGCYFNSMGCGFLRKYKNMNADLAFHEYVRRGFTRKIPSSNGNYRCFLFALETWNLFVAEDNIIRSIFEYHDEYHAYFKKYYQIVIK